MIRGVLVAALFVWSTTLLAFYTAEGKNEVDGYAVPGHDAVLLAAPQHKVTGGARARLPHGIYASTTVAWLGERWGYAGDGAGNSVLEKFDSLTLVNAQLGWRDPVSKLDVSLGVFNLFDAPYSYIQPYDGEHSPMPAEPREIAARVSMGF